MKRLLMIAYLVTVCCMNIEGSSPSLLFCIPSRGRPQQLIKNLNCLYKQLSHEIPYKILINADADDESMNNQVMRRRLEGYPDLELHIDDNQTKIAAFNAHIDAQDFDILIVMHDDMEAVTKDFDKIIVDQMLQHFPDFDGVLNFNDGFVGGQCNTIPIMGSTYFKRFGYVYNPSYISTIANLELTHVSKILKKEAIVDQVIIRHNHPAWNAGKADDIYKRSAQYYNKDVQTFKRRQMRTYDLPYEVMRAATPRLWSILICTIDGREESFNRLCTNLTNQINALGLQNEIEILACKDARGEHTVGFKRNKLMEMSSGFYTQFCDDDDMVSDDFVQKIYEKLQKLPDCVSLTGVITTRGSNPKKFIHSIAHDHYFEENNVYFRPPNHLNPIKRSIGIQFRFPDKNFSEDTDWAMAIANSKLIKTEEVIDTPYYFYQYDPANSAALP